MQAILLCGGLSTRLGDITKETPKILLEIGGKTVLQHQVELLVEAGVEEVVLASGHLHDILQERVGSSLGGTPIRYVREEKRLGTGGAIKNAMKAITRFPAFVLNGDILLDASLRKMALALRPEMDGILLGVEVEDARSYGRLVFEPDTLHIQQFVEKDPNHQGAGHINGGVYLFQSSIQSYFPDRESFSVEYDVFPYVKSLYIHPYKGTWIDIGTPERLAFARENLTHLIQVQRGEGNSHG
ncbi:NTP transferase domain-containing protein [Myxococcota bacterium]|nr:NTP transferase domain-containing protein [Myxococcota bacterium]